MHEPFELTEKAQWDKLAAQSAQTPVLVFKHSTSCPVSAEAHEHFVRYLKQPQPGIAYAYVRVIESRPVSNHIAQTLQVKHQSPQAILVRDGQAVWHDSHWRLTEDKFKQTLDGIV